MKKLFIIGLILFSTVISAQSKQDVYNWIIQSGIKHPKIVYAQYGLESGWGKSKAAVNKCNLFGFMYKGKIIEFESQYHSVLYYKKWQNKRYKGGDYYQFLEDINYAQDSIYIVRLKQIIKSL